MNKLFAVFLLLISTYMFTACGAQEMLRVDFAGALLSTLATATPSPLSSSILKREVTSTPYCHGDYDEIGSFCVYIQQFSTEDDYIVVRPVEWIIPKDEKRIEELGLDLERDLICGYYIKDWGFSEMKIPITEDTEYHFIDYWHEYLELEKQGLCTITEEEEIFISNWEKYASMMTKYPFFVELNEDGTLKLISEKVIP